METKVKYSNTEYLRMAMCYFECSKDVSKARKLFAEKFFWYPADPSCFVDAAKMYGCLQKVNNTTSQEEECQRKRTITCSSGPSQSEEPEVKAKQMKIKDNNECTTLKDNRVTIVNIDGEIKIIKEEYDEDSYSNIEIEFERFTRKPYLTLTPIVYTTRLDDMKIFERIKSCSDKKLNVTVKNITNRIILESKPKYNNKSSNIVNVNKKTKSLEYITEKIQIINKIAATEATSNNEDSITKYSLQPKVSDDVVEKDMVLNVCKPFSIILERLPDTVLDINKNDDSDVEVMVPRLSDTDLDINKNDHSNIEEMIPRLSDTDLDINKNDHSNIEEMIPRFEVENKPDEDKEESGSSTKIHVITNHFNENINYCIIIRDHSCNETSVYYICKGVLANYYSHPKILDTFQIPKADKIRELNVCCWINRHDQIGFLLPKNSTIKTFMDKIHGCPPGKCNCCCAVERLNKTNDRRKGSSTKSPMDDDDMEIKMLEEQTLQLFNQMQNRPPCRKFGYSKNWLQELTSTKRISGTLIDVAMQYTRVSQQPKQTTNLAETGFQMKLIDSNEVEFLKLENSTDLLTYKRETMNSQHSLYDNIMKKNSSYCKRSCNEFICCWNTRRKIMRDWFQRQLHMRSFMTPPHSCQFGKCTCCCQVLPKKHVKVVDLSLPSPSKSFCYTESYVVGNKRSYNYSSKEQINLKSYFTKEMPDTSATGVTTKPSSSTAAFTELCNRPTVQKTNIVNVPKINSNLTAALLRREKSAKRKTIQPQLVKLPDKTMVGSSCNIGTPNSPTVSRTLETLLLSSNTSKTVQPQLLKQPTVSINSEAILPTSNAVILPSKPIKDVSQSVNTSPQELPVDSMITTILDTFKDVRLTINENGKVTAELPTPVHKMNTAELKVLANILNHAQQQVHDLGLAPGTILHNQYPKTFQMEVPASSSSTDNQIMKKLDDVLKQCSKSIQMAVTDSSNTDIQIKNEMDEEISCTDNKIKNDLDDLGRDPDSIPDNQNSNSIQMDVPGPSSIDNHIQNKLDDRGRSPGNIDNQNSKLLQMLVAPRRTITNKTTTIRNTTNTEARALQCAKIDAQKAFSNIMNANYRSFKSSFVNDITHSFLPVISNVFSLQSDQEASTFSGSHETDEIDTNKSVPRSIENVPSSKCITTPTSTCVIPANGDNLLSVIPSLNELRQVISQKMNSSNTVRIAPSPSSVHNTTKTKTSVTPEQKTNKTPRRIPLLLRKSRVNTERNRRNVDNHIISLLKINQVMGSGKYVPGLQTTPAGGQGSAILGTIADPDKAVQVKSTRHSVSSKEINRPNVGNNIMSLLKINQVMGGVEFVPGLKTTPAGGQGSAILGTIADSVKGKQVKSTGPSVSTQERNRPNVDNNIIRLPKINQVMGGVEFVPGLKNTPAGGQDGANLGTIVDPDKAVQVKSTGPSVSSQEILQKIANAVSFTQSVESYTTKQPATVNINTNTPPPLVMINVNQKPVLTCANLVNMLETTPCTGIESIIHEIESDEDKELEEEVILDLSDSS